MKNKVKVTSRLLTLSEQAEEWLVEEFVGEEVRRGELIQLRYEEPDNKGDTTIRVDMNKIKLIRQGEVNSEMIFKLNTSTPLHYQTPQGNLSFQIKTIALDKHISSQKGNLKIHYYLYSGKIQMVENKLEIAWHTEITAQP